MKYSVFWASVMSCELSKSTERNRRQGKEVLDRNERECTTTSWSDVLDADTILTNCGSTLRVREMEQHFLGEFWS